MTADELDKENKYINMRLLWLSQAYPLTIIADRYGGVYSGGNFTAFPTDYYNIPDDASASDNECSDFWGSYTGYVGLGATPVEAYENLKQNIKNQKHYNEL